jgi:HPt (histidine-containing phosphotransfer) domain-containing protein
MPVMGGVEAAAAIRELERETARSTRFPIIAITAPALLEEQERFMSGGIVYVVTKPLRPADLDAALSQLLSEEPKTPPHQGTPPPPLPVDSALRDLTTRLWQEVEMQRPGDSSPLCTEGIDIIDVFERSGESPRRTKLMLNAFLGSYHDSLNKLHDISDPEALTEVTRAAHSLKGILLDVGAKHVAGLASSLERSLQTGDVAGAALHFETCRTETTLVATLIERVVRHFPHHEAS